MKNDRAYWGRRAAFYLIKDLNCALASHEAIQGIIGRQEDSVLRAVTGLEGGVVASGSTCGVITGGALGLALAFDRALQERGPPAEAGITDLVGQYSRWFGDSYGTTFCRLRSRADFYKPWGQIRYLLPGDRVAGCLWHIRGAIRYLHDRIRAGLPETGGLSGGAVHQPVHCALGVLDLFRKRTGIGNDPLDRIAFVLDGGVGLSGGVCGALVGAILGINLKFGLDIRQGNLRDTIKAFLIGHINLLKEHPMGAPEPFCIGKEIVANFRQRAGSMNCRELTGQSFEGYDDFQGFIGKAAVCRGLIEFAADEAVGAIRKWGV
ncbi:MAG: C_GCAxxG_C_C family protein [Deltaproteobacteria bacterium]|nr:C_GCAxxG_C_C family protein [Deltaproteobacteria bacterium]